MSAALALLQLRGARDDVMRELDELIADAEAAAPAEAEAATTIQRCFRGSRVRARLSFMASMAIVIQRLFRGFRGRRSFATALRAKEQQARLSVFHFFATAIQRTFRGYYSRKHVHHFYARKQFIAMVAAKSDALREQLATEEMLQREEDERRREEEAVAEFKRVAKNLHHLTSTKTCPGVFNSPYLPSQMTAFNKPVEQHLKEATHELFATTGLYKRRSKKPPRRLRSTIRASTPYDEEVKKTREETKFSRLRRLTPKDFRAGGKVAEPPAEPTVKASDPYLEAREVRKLTVRGGADDTTKRVSPEPFRVAVPAGRVFDDSMI